MESRAAVTVSGECYSGPRQAGLSSTNGERLYFRQLQPRQDQYFDTNVLPNYISPVIRDGSSTWQYSAPFRRVVQSPKSVTSATLSPPSEGDFCFDVNPGPSTPEWNAPSPPFTDHAPQQTADQNFRHLNNFLGYDHLGSAVMSDLDPEQLLQAFYPSSLKHEDMSLDGAMEPAETSTSNDRAKLETPVDPSLSLRIDAVSQESLRYPIQNNVISTLPYGNALGVMDLSPGPDPPAPIRMLPTCQRRSKSSSSKPRRISKQITRAASQRPMLSSAASTGQGKKPQSATTSATSAVVAGHLDGIWICPTCDSSFADEIALQKHNRSQHLRPFKCVFHYAGCTSVFGAKNEWKRHVLSQHLGLHYWHCTAGHCRQANPAHAHGRLQSRGMPHCGSVFNRKDLYTQHVRRMHLQATGVESSTVEQRLRSMQASALRTRCQLPEYMRCPAPDCDHSFLGSKAWDDRMEHVALHLDAAAAGREPEVFFGGDTDPTLSEWAASEAVGVAVRVNEGWQLCNPLKGNRSATTSISPIQEEDAEGEDWNS